MSQVDVLTLNIADDVLKEYSLHFVELHGMHIRLQALVLLLTILFCKGVKQEKRHKTFLRQRHMTKMNERLSLQDTPKHRHHSHNIDMDINTDTSPIDVTHNKRDTSRRQNQNTPQKSMGNSKSQTKMQCCPSLTSRTQPLGGLSREGKLVVLYRDHTTRQTFYETSCLPHVKDTKCLFIHPDYEDRSKCEQQFSYAYAIVTDYGSPGPYRMDYIRIKSECKCVIS